MDDFGAWLVWKPKNLSRVGSHLPKALPLRPSDGLQPLNFIYITIWLFNIAMEHGPFIDGLPINSMVIFHGYVK